MSKRVSFLGLRIDEMTPAEAVDTIRGFWQTRAKNRVFFVNAHCFNVASTDALYRDALGAADLVLADGSGLLLASRLLRLPIHHNLNGTDLVPLLCAAAAEEERSVFLLGAKPGIAEQAAQNLQTRYPGLKIAGVRHGYFTPGESAEVIAQINAARPDMLFVAMGVPLQECWITDHFAGLDVPVSLAVGALLDFLSNTFPRAPRLFRQLGIEWVYRLYLEPRRLWRRYIVGNVLFMSRVLFRRDTSKAALPLPPPSEPSAAEMAPDLTQLARANAAQGEDAVVERVPARATSPHEVARS